MSTKKQKSDTQKAAKPWQFQKGQSGNPSGRPALPEEFKRITEAEALPSVKFLINLRNNKKASMSLRLRAAETLLAYGVGKPVETIKADVDHTIINNYEEIRKRLGIGE